jgi:hypothetical protein
MDACCQCPVFKNHVPATPVGIGMLFCRARASQVVGTRRKYPDLSVQHGLACGDAVTQAVGRHCLPIFLEYF